MPKLSLRDLDLEHKRVLIRVDFNVPLKDGVITDDTRIRETLPTIEYALRHKAKVILCSHLGRPKGKPVESMSLKPLVARLRSLLDHVLNQGENVAFSPDCVGEIAQEMATPTRAWPDAAARKSSLPSLKKKRTTPTSQNNSRRSATSM